MLRKLDRWIGRHMSARRWKVTLDFIPVEERLPVANVYGIVRRRPKIVEVWYDHEDKAWRDFWRNVEVDVTHWAEIPTIEEQDDQAA